MPNDVEEKTDNVGINIMVGCTLRSIELGFHLLKTKRCREGQLHEVTKDATISAGGIQSIDTCVA